MGDRRGALDADRTARVGPGVDRLARPGPRRGGARGAGVAGVAGGVRPRLAGRNWRGLLLARGLPRPGLRAQPARRRRGRDRTRPVERGATVAARLPGALRPEHHRSGRSSGTVRDAGRRRRARVHIGRGRDSVELGRGVRRPGLAERLLGIRAGDGSVLRHVGLAARRRRHADRAGRQRRRRWPRARPRSGNRRRDLVVARRGSRLCVADRGRDRGAAAGGDADRIVDSRSRCRERRVPVERAVHRRMAREHHDAGLDRHAPGGLGSPPGDARVRSPARR